MKPISIFGFPLGITATFWLVVGIIRRLTEGHQPDKKRRGRKRYKPQDVAAIVPAHNEELVIRKCVKALKQSLDKDQIYVISDGSTDKTYTRARMEGRHASNLTPGRGKAKALTYAIKRYKLYRQYKLILIVDADTQIDEKFISRSLNMFNKDKSIGVVFGSPRIRWPQHIIPSLEYFFLAYRERLVRMIQYFYLYGQTWKHANTSYVIPGFATMYRVDVLEKLSIDTPGLLIEDFSLAFQFQKKKLGIIGYHPSIIGWDQYPDNLRDYWSQVRRWNIGFFQTVKRFGVWPSFFSLSLGAFEIEVLIYSVFIILMPFLLLFLLSLSLGQTIPLLGNYAVLYQRLGLYTNISFGYIFAIIYGLDYLLTVAIGVIERKPQFLFYGLFFYFMHYVTALILLTSLIPGLFKSSSGRWDSPTRSSQQLGTSV
ncbi:glycosyltransferase [Patescibacteria group bacterium]|nr:glycosyltransferase [Patescibacteria group bacterium]